MRNLTIKRAKSFVGCLKKASVYIEDPTASELIIGKVPCRKIGQLKNGEEKTFQIEETAAKVFVIADKLSKDFCNDFYQLPEGQEDIFLSGKNKYSIAAANAFRFDNNNNAEAIANRKRTATKIGPVIVGIILGIGIYVGIANAHRFVSTPEPQDKTFSYQEMHITLTDEFREMESGENTIAYDSPNKAVFVLKEPFAMAEGFGDLSLEEYADLVIQVNGINYGKAKKVDGLVTFEHTFTNPETKQTFRYFSYVYKTNDAFWLIQFTALDKDAQKYEEQFLNWAKRIRFTNEKGV